MSTNNVSLITDPLTSENLIAISVAGGQVVTVSQLNARMTQLEEARTKVYKMLNAMESLVRESLSKQRKLEEYIQTMQESFQEQEHRFRHELDWVAWEWRGIIEPIHARVEELQMDQMKRDESYLDLSSRVAMLEDDTRGWSLRMELEDVTCADGSIPTYA